MDLPDHDLYVVVAAIGQPDESEAPEVIGSDMEMAKEENAIGVSRRFIKNEGQAPRVGKIVFSEEKQALSKMPPTDQQIDKLIKSIYPKSFKKLTSTQINSLRFQILEWYRTL